ncbi:hypothetical protein AB0C65_00440 [Nocardia sp. NPDC048505]|uniref:hypothetical protein n=1 Tax=Nocardia sp. NPDC048505 TaxID=3155756 RepID=UPI00340F702A
MTGHPVELGSSYTVTFPEYLDGYEWEAEAKGFLVGVTVSTLAATFVVTVYDLTRLTQDLADEVRATGHSTLSNVLVVPAVTRAEILRAVERVAADGFDGLHPQAAG